MTPLDIVNHKRQQRLKHGFSKPRISATCFFRRLQTAQMLYANPKVPVGMDLPQCDQCGFVIMLSDCSLHLVEQRRNLRHWRKEVTGDHRIQHSGVAAKVVRKRR